MRNFDDDIIPIQIRPDIVVRIHGIPFDMTPDEADKIARVVKAMAQEKGQDDG